MTHFMAFIAGLCSGVVLVVLGMYIATVIETDIDDGIYEDYELEETDEHKGR